ncbi:MAG TPA: hypothetical protein VIW70_07645 [Rubrivivax sp.]
MTSRSRFNDGYDETLDELRVPMEMLTDAGIVTPEVESMREVAALRQVARAAMNRQTKGAASPSRAITFCTAGRASIR